jgi:hypothetical protein
MKTKNYSRISNFVIAVCTLLLISAHSQATKNDEKDPFTEYKGLVVDKSTGNALAYANISLIGTNIATITNTNGEFSIKVPEGRTNNKILVRFVGFRSKTVLLSDLENIRNKIELEPVNVVLPEVSVISKDADALVQTMFDKIRDNYSGKPVNMTAFYRETIRKNKSYVSVSEAVVDIYKQPYPSYKSDVAKLYKSRKKTDYNKIDTLVFKLMGGPFNSLYLDIMKYPEIIFTDNFIQNYKFTFDRSTYMDKQLIYVVDFVQTVPDNEPLYKGKLYIDAHNMALKSAIFDMNIKNKESAASMFIVKKPFNANVYPVQASYRMDFFENDGKWYYGYSRIELGIKIDWKRKLFNTLYHSVIEMAVTDWENGDEQQTVDRKDRIRHNVVISDEASGFSDPDFWGEHNVIEPEKPIETAIKKIQKQLEKKE